MAKMKIRKDWSWEWVWFSTSMALAVALFFSVHFARDSGIKTGRRIERETMQNVTDNLTVKTTWRALSAMLLKQAKEGWEIRLEGDDGRPVTINVVRIQDDSGRYPR